MTGTYVIIGMPGSGKRSIGRQLAFRESVCKVMAYLISGSARVLSMGGGAFMNEETCKLIKKLAFSIWLKADFDVLIKRCLRKKADITVLIDERPIDETIDKAIAAIQTYHCNKG